MSLSRKASFRGSTKNLHATQTLFEQYVRTQIENIDSSIEIEDTDTIINGLKTIEANQDCSNINQEDLPKLFVELGFPIGGHDIRKKISNRNIKLESTKPISLEILVNLFQEIKKEREEHDGKMDFRSMLSKAKNLVRVTKRKNKTKLNDVKEVEEKSNVQLQQISVQENSVREKQPVDPLSSMEVTEVEECQNEFAKENLELEHHYSMVERVSFTNWINEQLKHDELSKPYLPINPDCESDLFEKLSDGIVFCRMLQLVSPDLINQRAINKTIKHQFHKIENQNLVLNTATSIGCVVVNQDVTGLIDEVPYLQLGLLWQIIRAGLFCKIQVNKSPEIFDALRSILADDESKADLQAMSPEEILLRWVNYHLEQNENYEGEPIRNFGQDIKDSTAYQHLLQQLFKHEKIDVHKLDLLNWCYILTFD